MIRALAFLLAAALVIVAVIVSREQSAIYAMHLIQAKAPEARANMLFSPCPLTPANVPVTARKVA